MFQFHTFQHEVKTMIDRAWFLFYACTRISKFPQTSVLLVTKKSTPKTTNWIATIFGKMWIIPFKTCEPFLFSFDPIFECRLLVDGLRKRALQFFHYLCIRANLRSVRNGNVKSWRRKREGRIGKFGIEEEDGKVANGFTVAVSFCNSTYIIKMIKLFTQIQSSQSSFD